MSIKSLLKSLLEKAMLRLGSRGGTLSTEVIEIVYQTNFTTEGGNASFEYVAPCDGELCIFLQCSASNGLMPAIDIRTNNVVRHTARTIDGSTWQMLGKGQKCVVSYFDANATILQWNVRFIKNEGSLV
jgi:hypothetical protein|nr:MAG TPA_asm: hypothetical protein [Caudoviricetes sp.]